MNKIEYDKTSDCYVFECPNCNSFIIVNSNEFNCKIFRHGVYKNSNEQINPHLEKAECDRLFNEDLIYGCGKPFQIIHDNDEFVVQICDYI